MNEAVFREVNEQIRQLSEGSPRPRLKLVCECGNSSCDRPIRMEVEEYERLRSDPCLFAVVRGHEEPDVETVQEEHDRYAVVRKREGVPGLIARSTDPRR
jgi:hypothetical protein